jgi:hypothetical protein
LGGELPVERAVTSDEKTELGAGIGDGRFKIQEWRGPDEIGINSLAARANRLVL